MPDDPSSARFSFDLTSEPWIPVLTVAGRSEQMSLRQVLLDAHKVRELAGDVPTQDPALLRILLAILHRALDGPPDREAWAQLWAAERLPAEPIEDYLTRWRRRFELFDGEAPFLQVAGLATAKGETRTANLLIPAAASGNNVPLFRASLDDRPPSLTPAEAARWLVHAHAYDTGSAKSGAVGDPAVKGGKSYAAEPALGRVGAVVPVGRDLRETLLLNLVALSEDNLVRRTRDDLPTWERPPLDPSYAERRLAGPVDLYTFPARRIRLVPDRVPGADDPDDVGEIVVRRIVLTAGDRLDPVDLAMVDPHTGLVRSPTLEKKQPPPVYVPARHRVGRALWRGMAGLLSRARTTTAADAPRYRGPAVLAWLDRLREDGSLAEDYPLGVLAYGVEYGDQSAFVREVFVDRLPFPVRMLAPGSPAETAALDAVAKAEAVADALRRLVGQVRRACGDDESSRAPDRETELFYARLDAPYRRFLVHLAEGAELGDLGRAWRQVLADCALEQADDILVVPARALFVARSYHKRDVTAGSAERWFRIQLAELLPDTTAGPRRPGKESA